MVEEQLAESRAHGQLVIAGLLDMAADAVDFGAGALLRADGFESLRSLAHDVGHVGQRFDIVDDRGFLI